jgi:predicted transcriptional regulator
MEGCLDAEGKKKKEIEEERVICLSQGKKFKSSQVNAKSLFFFKSLRVY